MAIVTAAERPDRPAAIRAALRRLVARHGFHGASMSAVAREAGVAAGTAYVHYESSLRVQVAGRTETSRDQVDTPELFFGLDAAVTFSEGRYGFVLRGDLGGFGIGDAALLAWKLVAAYRYRPAEEISVEIGYRGVSFEVEYGHDRFEFEGTAHGLFGAVNLHF